MRPWCLRFFGRERNAKKNENLTVKIQQAAANDTIFSSTFYFFLRTIRQKKKNRGKKLEKLLPLCLVYVWHQRRFGQPRTIWRRGWLQKAATTRDRCAVHMCASSVFSRRATSPAHAQRKNCRYFSTWSRWDHEKTNLVFRRSLDRGGIVLTSSKKTKNIYMILCIFLVWVRMPAEYWYHVS